MNTKIIEESHPDYDEMRSLYLNELRNMALRAAQEAASKVLEAVLDVAMVEDAQRFLTDDFRGWHCRPNGNLGKLYDFEHVDQLPDIITKNME